MSRHRCSNPAGIDNLNCLFNLSLFEESSNWWMKSPDDSCGLNASQIWPRSFTIPTNIHIQYYINSLQYSLLLNMLIFLSSEVHGQYRWSGSKLEHAPAQRKEPLKRWLHRCFNTRCIKSIEKNRHLSRTRNILISVIYRKDVHTACINGFRSSEKKCVHLCKHRVVYTSSDQTSSFGCFSPSGSALHYLTVAERLINDAAKDVAKISSCLVENQSLCRGWMITNLMK